MKIKYQSDLIIIYLYKHFLEYDNKDKLHHEIKEIFINLIKNYNLDLFGYFKVDIYENKKYGCILEINKIYSDNSDYIDLKVILHHNTKFYLVMNEYYFLNIEHVKYHNNNFYLDIDNIENLDNYIEFGEIYYDK